MTSVQQRKLQQLKKRYIAEGYKMAKKKLLKEKMSEQEMYLAKVEDMDRDIDELVADSDEFVSEFSKYFKELNNGYSRKDKAVMGKAISDLITTSIMLLQDISRAEVKLTTQHMENLKELCNRFDTIDYFYAG